MAIKLLLDADLPKALATAIRRRIPGLDIRRVHESGLGEASDEEILEFAASQGRIILTRDKATMRQLAAERVRKSQPMPGLLVVRRGFAVGGTGIGTLVDELELIAGASEVIEWNGIVHSFPSSPIERPVMAACITQVPLATAARFHKGHRRLLPARLRPCP